MINCLGSCLQWASTSLDSALFLCSSAVTGRRATNQTVNDRNTQVPHSWHSSWCHRLQTLLSPYPPASRSTGQSQSPNQLPESEIIILPDASSWGPRNYNCMLITTKGDVITRANHNYAAMRCSTKNGEVWDSSLKSPGLTKHPRDSNKMDKQRARRA
jgi:hypothetical protein